MGLGVMPMIRPQYPLRGTVFDVGGLPHLKVMMLAWATSMA